MKKTKQTRQSTSKNSSTGRVVSRTAQKNVQKARDNAQNRNKKQTVKKTTKKTTKRVVKKHTKKRGSSRRQGPKTNAQRIVSSTQSNGEQKTAKIPKTAKDTLRIIPMVGQEEVGRNMVIFEYGKDIVIVDMGMQFPEEDMPGIDYIVPNANYLKGKEQNILGVIFTHGHLDHIGAAPVLLKELGYPPVIARDLTLALIKKKLEDGDPGASDKIRTISVKNIDRKIRLGAFIANFFEVEHSIMDSMGVALVTPVGTAIHLGDWTISHDPADGQRVSYEKLKDFPAPRILMLESLGVMKKEIKSEKEVQVNLEMLVKQAKGRIILGTFASQIKRIKLLLQYAQKIGRKVALDGYSMRTNVEIAQQLGYLNVSKNLLIPINDIDKYPDNKILVLCTGAQGEHNAVLNRIVTDNHRFIKLKKTDTIVFSSSVIPGNERSVQRLKDNLYRKCDNVVHSDIMDIHMGGHATQGDIKEMIKFAQPQYFIPIYANYFMLKEAAKLAVEDGFSPKRIAILDNGSMIEFSKKGSRIRKEKADASYVFVDGLGVGDIGHVVLRDRQMLSEDGMYVITVLIDSKTKEVVGNMQITSRGFIYVKDNFDLVNETKKKVKTIVKKTTSKDAKMDSRQVENEIRDRIGEYLFQKTQRRPMILPVVIEV
jgi:ribonuclease J